MNAHDAPADHAPRVAVRFEERPFDDAGSRFARSWAAGQAIVGGAEDGRSRYFTPAMASGTAAPPDAPRYPDDPLQNPKTPVLDSEFLAKIATDFLLLRPPRVLTLRVLTIGRSTLVATPFEPTVVAGRRVEEAVRAAIIAAEGPEAPRAECVRVAGYAGAFNGYLTTPEEYDVQLYEGAHTLWGRESQPEVGLRCARLALVPPAPASGVAEFPDVFHPRPTFLFEGPGVREKAEWSDPVAEADGDEIVAHFVVTQSKPPAFADGPWTIVERRAAPIPDWVVAEIDGAPCDDASGFASIGRRERVYLDRDGFARFQYRYEFRAPAAPLRALGGTLRIRLDFGSGLRRTIPVRLD
jgi:hypothetical protein